MEATRLFSSTELTTAAGCTRKALRYYQGKGLINPIRQTGNKRYDESAFHRLRLIVGLRDAGLSIEEITQLLEAHKAEPNGPAAKAATEISDELDVLINSVGERIDALRRVRHRLVTARETLAGCKVCEHELSRCGECAHNGHLDSTTRALLTDV